MAYVGGSDGTMILDHEFVVVSLLFMLFFDASSLVLTHWQDQVEQPRRRHELSDRSSPDASPVTNSG